MSNGEEVGVPSVGLESGLKQKDLPGFEENETIIRWLSQRNLQQINISVSPLNVKYIPKEAIINQVIIILFLNRLLLSSPTYINIYII